LLREVVETAVRSDPLELPYDKQHRYFGFTDASGGGADEYALGIAHREGDDTIIDLVRARRGIPAEITAGYAALLKSYGIRKVTGDKYAGSWPADEFKKYDIDYTPSEKPKSGLYLDLLPALNSGRVETEGALRNLNAQRQHVAHPNTPNLEFPAADETLLRQLMQVRGYTYYRGPERIGWFSSAGGPQQLKIIAGALGLALPHPGRGSVAA